MSFFFKISLGREARPNDNAPSENEAGCSEQVFTDKMQEAVITLIKHSWAQYENVYFKLPERYFNKVKNYLWLVTLIVGAKIKISLDLYQHTKSITEDIFKTAISYGFIASSICEIVVFLVCIYALNARHQIAMSLESPYTFLCTYHKHSYELLYNMLHQIEEGVKTCKERIKKQNFYLECIGWFLFADIIIITGIVMCVFKILQGSST